MICAGLRMGAKSCASGEIHTPKDIIANILEEERN